METITEMTNNIINEIIKIIKEGDDYKLVELCIEDIDKNIGLSKEGIIGKLQYTDILTKAISNNRLNIVKFLLDYGVDTDYYSKNVKYPPLHESIIQYNYYIFKVLLDKGANVNIQNRIDGNTTLNLALKLFCMQKDNEEQKNLLINIIYDLLNNENIDVNIKNNANETSLQLAIYYDNNISIIKEILDKTKIDNIDSYTMEKLFSLYDPLGEIILESLIKKGLTQRMIKLLVEKEEKDVPFTTNIDSGIKSRKIIKRSKRRYKSVKVIKRSKKVTKRSKKVTKRSKRRSRI